MEMKSLEPLMRKGAGIEGAEIGKLLEELNKLPRREKRGYRIAPYGAFPMRFVDIRSGICPRCYWGTLRRRHGCSCRRQDRRRKVRD